MPAQATVRFMVHTLLRNLLNQFSDMAQMILFGANDACLPGSEPDSQHVPLDIYKANLRRIIKYASNATAQTQPLRMILVTPPPINEYALEVTDAAKGVLHRRRTAEHTMMYADACKSVGQELEISVLDLWALCIKGAQYQPGDLLPGSKKVARNQYLDQVLSDGNCKRSSCVGKDPHQSRPPPQPCRISAAV